MQIQFRRTSCARPCHGIRGPRLQTSPPGVSQPSPPSPAPHPPNPYTAEAPRARASARVRGGRVGRSPECEVAKIRTCSLYLQPSLIEHRVAHDTSAGIVVFDVVLGWSGLDWGADTFRSSDQPKLGQVLSNFDC